MTNIDVGKIWLSDELSQSSYFPNNLNIRKFKTNVEKDSVIFKDNYYCSDNKFMLVDFTIKYDFGKYIVLLLLKNEQGDFIESKTSLDLISHYIKYFYKNSIYKENFAEEDEVIQVSPIYMSVLNDGNEDIGLVYQSGKHLLLIERINNSNKKANKLQDELSQKLDIKTTLLRKKYANKKEPS